MIYSYINLIQNKNYFLKLWINCNSKTEKHNKHTCTFINNLTNIKKNYPIATHFTTIVSNGNKPINERYKDDKNVGQQPATSHEFSLSF